MSTSRHDEEGCVRNLVRLDDGRTFEVRFHARPGPGRRPARVKPTGMLVYVDAVELHD